MKYDDASWHYGSDFPDDLLDEAGATHTGMFLAWALLSGLAGDIHINEIPEGLVSLQKRSTTPGQFFLSYCDGKFTDEDLNEEGNAFTVDYYQEGAFFEDYEEAVAADLPAIYYVADTWENFDQLKPIFDQTLREWKQ
jgi:hypothetical protein